MIFDANGHCFTNHHVIKEARAIKVHIPTTRTTMSARLIAGDEANDVAIIKIEGWKPHDKAHPPPLANAAAARLGDRVFTIGFPLAGYLSQDPKYTSGDISAFTGLGDDRRLIQITTPIQPGNSGGPLVLEDGRVVGVIVSLIDRIPKHVDSRGLDAQNINFAVKIDYLRLLAAGSGVEIPEGHKAGPDVIEQVRLHTVQIKTE